MRIRKLFVVVIILIACSGCQFNSLEEPVDCSLSDLAFSATIQNTECGQTTGSIQIMATGGVAPYTYRLGDEPTSTEPVFSNLGAGEYSITITDNAGCTSENSALIANTNGFLVSASSTVSECLSNSGTLTLVATNGVRPYLYQIDGGTPQADSIFVVGPGLYIITVLDATNCDFVFAAQVNSSTSYQLDVQPIMANNCNIFGCHDGSNSSLPNFENFSVVRSNAAMIRSRTQSGNMPRNGTLTQAEKDLIACWVDDGAINN